MSMIDNIIPVSIALVHISSVKLVDESSVLVENTGLRSWKLAKKGDFRKNLSTVLPDFE